MRRAALAIPFALLAAPALAQQEAPCHPDDIGITVCPSGHAELRIIRGTFSPKKRYGIAWDTEEGRTGRDYQLFSGEFKARYAGGDSDTFLVRLMDGKSLTKLKGAHPGDAQRYNHQIQRAVWSLDETWLIAINESKWETDNADVYRIDANGVSEPFDLKPLCIDAERRYFTSTGRKIQIDKFQQWIDVKSVSDNGAIAAVCSMQIMKQDDAFQFFVTLKLQIATKGPTAKLVSVKRCRDFTGACKPAEVPD